MKIDRQIHNWARLIFESTEGDSVRESLNGDITNADVADYLEKMIRMYGRRMIKAVYVNDHAFISKDFAVSDESVDFKSAENRINEETLRMKDMISILRENGDKFCTFDGKRIVDVDFDIEDTDGSYLAIMETEDVTNESEQFDRAKKIGYMGDEKNVEDWLKGDYATWKQHCLDVFTRLSNGDEEKALELFKYYDNLSTAFIGSAQWDEEQRKYVPIRDMKKSFEKKLYDEFGEDVEIKEMMDKLEAKWSKDTKSIMDFYDSSSSRGGWTGD